MAKKIVSDLNVQGKKVLIRVDFNVPMKNGVITDDTRVRAALPTIQYVVENGGKAIVFSHLGRVKSVEDITKNNIKPVAARLEELIGRKVIFVDATRGAELEAAVNALAEGEILMFQSTRYEDFDVELGKEVKLESKNNPELGAYWASLGDGIFVNEWPIESKKIYTIYSICPEGFHGNLFEVHPEENTHFVDVYSHEELIPEMVDNKWYIKAKLKSFDRFDLGTNNTFRLELGPYYSQYIAGAIFIDNKKIAGAFNNGYYSPFNAGLIVGGGFWHNDFYIGADFDFIWDWAGEDAFPSFYMTAGYRF